MNAKTENKNPENEDLENKDTTNQDNPELEVEKQNQAEDEKQKQREADAAAKAEQEAKEKQKEKQVEAESRKVNPLIQQEFGLATHRRREFDANVPHGTSREDLESPDLWVNVARMMSIGDEIRVLPEDCAFYARLVVVHAIGTQVKCKVVSFVDLEAVSPVEAEEGPYKVQMRGRLKWCIIESKSGNIVRKNIGTQNQAIRDMGDMVKALSL